MENLLTAQPAQLPDWAATALNLADPRLGAETVACSDDFFAPMARMLQATPPIFAVGRYDDHGKWMDGWESRRKRGPGHDWAVVRLGRPGAIAGFEVDTSFFTGNFPPACAIDACVSPDPVPGAATVWETLLPPTPLEGDSHQFFSLAGRGGDRAWTHVRLNILPDGGVARLRVYGRPVPAWQALPAGTEVDLLAAENGGRAVAWNDAHFGAAANLILPGRGVNMGDGWETRRRREPGHGALPGHCPAHLYSGPFRRHCHCFDLDLFSGHRPGFLGRGHLCRPHDRHCPGRGASPAHCG